MLKRVLRLADLSEFLQKFPSAGAVLSLSVVMILATAISTTALLLDLRKKELERARSEIATLSRVLSEQTTRTFEGVTLTLRSAKDRLSDQIGRRLELDSPPIRFLLQARSSGLTQVKSIFVADEHGRGVNSSREDFIRRLDMTERTFFRYFTDGGNNEIYISPPEKARVDDQWTFYVSTRLDHPDGQFRGIVVAAISIDYFEHLYESISLNSVGRIQLLDLNGVLMAGKPHDELECGMQTENQATLQRMLALPGNGAAQVREEHAQGTRLVAYSRVEQFPLVVRVSIDETEALAPWRSVMRPIVGVVAVMLFFVLAATFLMVRNLVRKGLLETALKESDEQLRDMVQSVQDAIVTVNSARAIVVFNSAAERMFGIPADRAIGRAMQEVLSPRLPPGQLQELMRHLEEGWHADAEQPPLGIIELENDGQEFPVELSLSRTMFRGERLLTAVFRDLTERKRTELELLETNRQLHSLSATLQNYREEERTRIARELHDELGQLLTGIRMEVSWLAGRLAPDQGRLSDKIASVKGQIDQTIGTVRRISSELRPLVLDDLGFAAAATWYVDQFSARTGIPVELSLPDVDPERGDAVATALFRVLQESLTNVARHAEASKVGVRLEFADDSWILSIRDDGCGFVHEPEKGGDIGLVSMRERAQNLGGRFAVNSAPGAGTTVEVIIPCKKPQEGNSWTN